MIRHGLVHQSPGYICPYCPEREHKYPRPDNLQRSATPRHPPRPGSEANLLLDTFESTIPPKIRTMPNSVKSSLNASKAETGAGDVELVDRTIALLSPQGFVYVQLYLLSIFISPVVWKLPLDVVTMLMRILLHGARSTELVTA